MALHLAAPHASFFSCLPDQRAPHPVAALQSLIGGTIMGFAWALIPGGIDAMVLYLVPSLALHGIVAYATMLTTLIGIESLKRRGLLSTQS